MNSSALRCCLIGFGRAVHVGGPDRLVSVLRPGAGLDRLRRTDVLVALLLFDPCGDTRLGFGRDPSRVGSHVGDETGRPFGAELDAFIEVLRDPHGAARRKPQPAGGVLLERRGDVGRVRALRPALLLDPDDPIGRALELAQDVLGFGLGLDLKLDVGVRRTGVTSAAVEPGEEMCFGALLGQLGVDRPRLDRDELADLLLAIDHQPQGDRGDPAGADSLLHLAQRNGLSR